MIFQECEDKGYKDVSLNLWSHYTAKEGQHQRS